MSFTYPATAKTTIKIGLRKKSNTHIMQVRKNVLPEYSQQRHDP